MGLPKLNLRDLFWMMAVVATGLGWWLDHSLLANDNRLLWHSISTGEKVLIGGDLIVAPRCTGHQSK